MARSDLLRTCTLALVMALVGNIWLVQLSRDDDQFAEIVGIASGIIAAAITLAYFVRPLGKFLGEAFLASLAVWVANLIEIWTDEFVRTETQIRQGGFYSALAVISLGAYLSTRRVEA